MSSAEHTVHKHINLSLSAFSKSRHSPISQGITFYLVSGQNYLEFMAFFRIIIWAIKQNLSIQDFVFKYEF